MTYEVQHYTIQYGWINTWEYDRGEGLKPETFDTAAEATTALDEHLQDLDAEYACGTIPRPYERTEFRVRHVPNIATEPNHQQGENA